MNVLLDLYQCKHQKLQYCYFPEEKLGQTVTINVQARKESSNTKNTDLPFFKRGELSVDVILGKWLVEMMAKCSNSMFPEFLNMPINLLLPGSLTL